MRKLFLAIGAVVVVAATGLGFVWKNIQNKDITFRGYVSGAIAPILGVGNNKLIRVNLHNHALTLYEGDTIVKQAKIAATGNPANSTRTPTGDFRILSKDKWHISSMSGVIMPWSLRFNGPYYFHDIPLHKDGSVITTTYSNGCIRLPSDLAVEMYNWASIGTRVQIYNAEFARAEGAPTVYLLTADGYRRPIATLEAFQSHGYRWQDVAIIPEQELAVLPLGTIIQ